VAAVVVAAAVAVAVWDVGAWIVYAFDMAKKRQLTMPKSAPQTCQSCRRANSALEQSCRHRGHRGAAGFDPEPT